MKLKLLTLLLIIISFTNVFGNSGVNYSRSSNYETLKLSIEDLKKIVSVIIYHNNESLQDTANHSKTYDFSCNLSGNHGKSISISSFTQLNNLKLDGDYTQLDLTYNSNYPSLAQVSISLHTYSRAMSVSGADENKVDAVYHEINSQLQSNVSFIAWINWSVIMITIVVSSAVLGVYALVFLFIEIIRRRATKNMILITFCLGVYLVLIMVYMISPITSDDIFPRFQLTSDSRNWWDKNSSLIGFLSFIFTIITIILNCVKFFIKKFNKKGGHIEELKA